MADDAQKADPDTLDHAALEHYLRPLRRFIDDPDTTEVCVNRPGVVFTEGRASWQRHEVPDLSFKHLSRLALVVANASRQRINEAENILSSTLPGGERIQVVVPPSVPQGTVSITIRTAPPAVNKQLDEYGQEGFFAGTRSVTPALTDDDWELIELRTTGTWQDFAAQAYRAKKHWLADLSDDEIQLLRLRDAGDWKAFFSLAVRSHQNIIISGGTGSGKTTFTRTLINDIDRESRIVTIEDTPELALPDHPNHVHLFYSIGGQGQSNSTPQSLLASCMRMKPDRILLAELRGPETSLYVQGLNSGHPGSITTVHSNSPRDAFSRLADLMRQHESCETLPQDLLLSKLYAAVHVVCQVKKHPKSDRRSMTEVFYDPRCRLAGVGPADYDFQV